MKKYCEKYDAHFESETGEWLEKNCNSKDCGFCNKRPKKHSPHKWEFIDRKVRICK